MSQNTSSDNAVKFAYWVPNVSGGLVVSTIEQRTDWSLEYNQKLAQTAERAGFEYALSQIRFTAGYGAEYQHESVSFSQALLHATTKLKVLAAILPGPWHPAVVAKQLPDSNPVKKVALDFTQRYEAAYGANTMTQFAADAWGAYMLLANAIPQALKAGKPGTVQFRTALRSALENTKNLTVPQGVINMNATDHVGLDQRSRVMGKIIGNKFTYAYGG